MDKQYCGYETLESENGNKIELQYYILKQSKLYSEIRETRIAYGMEIVKQEFLGDKRLLIEGESIEDVTTNFSEANDIMKSLKDNKVMPVHLRDIIENLI